MKEKTNENRIIAVVLVMALMLIAAVTALTRNVHGAQEDGMEDNGADMFVCDSLWSYCGQYPAENIFGVCYIPISMLAEIEGIEIKENTYLKNVLISYKNSYLTFDLAKGILYASDGSESKVTTYLIYVGQRYIPAQTVCSYFGLGFETKNGAVRITDANAKKSFNDLLLEYNPALADHIETVTETVPITEPPVETEPDTTPRIVAFTFDCGSRTEQILEILCKYDCRAAFFVSESYLDENADMVKLLNVYGMEIGIYAEFRGSGEGFSESIERSEERLEWLIRRRAHIVSSDKKGLQLIRNAGAFTDGMAEKGYVISNYNNPMYYLPKTKPSIIEYDAEKFISENELTVFRFPDDDNTLNVLGTLLEYISKHNNITISTVSDGNTPFTIG